MSNPAERTTPRKRPYTSTLRDDQAQMTRLRVVTAAGVLFAEHGYAATTIDAIARAAGVGRNTVFTSVPGGKPELIKLAYDYALAGDDAPTDMQDRPELQAVISEPDPYRRTVAHAAFVVVMGHRISALYMALRGGAEVDQEVRALFDRWERQRRDDMRTGPVARLREQQALKPGLRLTEATDVLALLTDPALYDRFVTRGGWSEPRYRRWLTDTMVDAVLSPTARPAPKARTRKTYG